MRRLISARPGMTWLVSRARAWVGGLVSGLLVLAAAQASAAEMKARDDLTTLYFTLAQAQVD